MRSCIILDVGGVLVHYDNKGFCSWLIERFGLSLTLSELMVIFKRCDIPKDLGEIDEHEFFRNFTREIGIEMTEEEYITTYYSHFVTYDVALRQFIERHLVDHYDLVIFSNNSAINLRDIRKHGFDKPFRKSVYSFEIHVRKPDADFFKKGLSIIGHKGEECVFFDDQLKSKENAEREGIAFVQFTDFITFKNDLERLHFL